MNQLISLPVLACLVLTSCAGVRYKSVPWHMPVTTSDDASEEDLALAAELNRVHAATNERRDEDLCGFRFYQPSTYLLVYSDGRGGIKWELHQLPDPSKTLSAQPYNYMSTLDLTLEFDNNFILSSVKEVADTAVVPETIIKQIAELAPALLGAAIVESADRQTFPAPLLFKLVTVEGELRLVGAGSTPNDINVTVLAAKSPKGKS